MATIDPNRTGLVFAALNGAWHLFWSLLVAVGWAQRVVDFLFWIHFIHPVYVIEPFEPGRAALLVAVTATIGYGGGFCLAWLWNWFHRMNRGANDGLATAPDTAPR